MSADHVAYLVPDDEGQLLVVHPVHQSASRIDETTGERSCVVGVDIDHLKPPGKVFPFRIHQKLLTYPVQTTYIVWIVHHSVLLLETRGRLGP